MAEGTGSGDPSRGHPTLVACLLAGLAGGLSAFVVGESTYGSFEAAGVARRFQGIVSDLPTPAARDLAMARESAAAFAGLGAALGLFLGLAGGMAGGGPRRGISAGVAGLVLGGLVGGLLSLGLLPGALRLRDRLDVDPILIGTATQALVWGPVAAAAGAAFGLALGGRGAAPRFALLALGGGVLAAILHGAAGAVLFPLAETDRPLATERGARLLAHLLVALCAAAAVGLGATARRRRAEPEPPAAATPAAS
ncbi:hypothetical protein [Paludisphaera sp.]|uniref:hypothetical protein n=1 Tax=Paludisphaera sp. TaxID=2017432 RepID=UPI00301E3E52